MVDGGGGGGKDGEGEGEGGTVMGLEEEMKKYGYV